MASATFIKHQRASRFPRPSDFKDSSIDRQFEEAFRAGLLLTGTLEHAEAAVLEGIERLYDEFSGQALVMETVKSALRQNAASAEQTGADISSLPPELRAVGKLPCDMRQCFVLRMLLGYDRNTCARLQHVSLEESDILLRLAVRHLASTQPVYFASFTTIYDC